VETSALTALRQCRPTPDARTRFLSCGFAVLPDLWSPSLSHELAGEAARLFPAAVAPSWRPRTPRPPAHAAGSTTPVARGPLLQELHTALTSLVRALSGRVLVPSFATYGFFPVDDGVVLHADTGAADVVLLTKVLGEVGPLHIRPDLAGQTPEQLSAHLGGPTWNPCTGVRLHHPGRGLTALRGASLPHHRPARAVPTLSAVAALHYRSPF
jgi:hypothetical protein